MIKIKLFLVCMIVFASMLRAQSLYSTKLDSLLLGDEGFVPAKTLVDKYNPKKPLWIPVVESIGLNLALGSFNAYVMQSEFAKISFNTIKHNFERGWTTDADGFITNMWAHPFNGSMYYNFARSGGNSYWTSLGVAAIGSWQWEFFMENEPPAFNDWIMTSVGGSMLGEMFYRFSDLILDESLQGSSRFWNELAAGIFNPARLFNRLIYGRTSRSTGEKLYERQPFLGELAFGANNVAEGTDFKDGNKNGMFTMDFSYGKLFNKRDGFKPFDFFRFNTALNFGIGKVKEDKQPPIGQFRIYGILDGHVSTVGEGSKFLWGFFNHYDYLENNVYQLGGVSVGPGIGFSTTEGGKTQFIGLLHAAALLMGGANSDYSQEYKVSFLDSARTYNMGPGAHVKLESVLRFTFGSLYLGYSFWWIHTWVGAPGNEYIGMLSPKFRVHVYKRWFLGLEYLLYHRFGKYNDFPDREYRNNEQRLFIGYAL